MSLNDSFTPDDALARQRAAFALAATDSLPLLIAYLDRDERYRFVNRAYELWFKTSRDRIEGRRLVEVIGEADYARVRRFLDVVLAGQPVSYDGEAAHVLAGLRHIDARFTPDFADDGSVAGFYMIVADASGRQTGDPELGRLLALERRRNALLDLGRQLREESDPVVIAAQACAMLGFQLGAPRAGYAEVDSEDRHATVVSEWAVDGFPSLDGSSWDLDELNAGMGAELRAGQPLNVPDVAADPRAFSPERLETYARRRIGAFLTSPLIKGRMTAFLYVCQDTPRAWTADEIAFVADTAELIWTASERARSEAALKQAEETERLLLREVDHRAKNVLSIVQSLAQLTPFESKPQYVEALRGRIGSLARSHGLLSNSRWIGVRLDALLRQELEPYGAGSDDRVVLDGPPVMIHAEAAQSVGLVVHELATNASKYGALADQAGALAVSWDWNAGGGLGLVWRETSARRVGAPERQGFGSTLISSAAKQLGARMTKDWSPDGLVFRLELSDGVAPAKPERVRPGPIGAGLAHDARALRDQRVLIVEDEALMAMELNRLLTDAGALVVGPAGGVEEALGLIAARPIDRAVLDVNLGGRLVTPVAEALAERAIPFIYLTGYSDPGVDGAPILRKPLNPEALLYALAAP